MLLVAVPFGLALSIIVYLAFQWRASRELLAKLEAAIEQHIDGLVQVRAHALHYDNSGRLSSRDWQQEIERFLDSQLSATLSERELRLLADRREDCAALVARRVANGVARLPVYQ